MSKVQERKLVRAELRRHRSEVLPRLKKEVSRLKTERKRRLSACRKEALALKKQVKKKAREAERRLRAHLARARDKARQAGKMCVSVDRQSVDDIEKALQAVELEKAEISALKQKYLGLIPRSGSRAGAGGRRRAELQQECDDRVRFNLSGQPELLQLFEKVRTKIKRKPRMTRTEVFLQWVHDNPEALDELRHDREREYEKQFEKELSELREPACAGNLEACRVQVMKLKRTLKKLEAVPF